MAASPETISKDTFADLLAAYPSVAEAISSSKSKSKNKSGAKTDKTLVELDAYRYETAPRVFGREGRAMTLGDVRMLVEWKLRHGKFRPTLMSLVSSNPPSLATETVSAAIEAYRAAKDVQRALDTLTKLRGVGPATASLLLSVHDPDGVVFFSDEAYHWLCCGGRKEAIRYTAKEYAELRARAGELAARLGVGMGSVEKVAYVVMRGEGGEKNQILVENAKGGKTEGVKIEKGGKTEEMKVEKSTTKKTDEVGEMDVERDEKGKQGKGVKQGGKAKAQDKKKDDASKRKTIDETNLRRSKRQRA